jgi:hypothetical protein
VGKRTSSSFRRSCQAQQVTSCYCTGTQRRSYSVEESITSSFRVSIAAISPFFINKGKRNPNLTCSLFARCDCTVIREYIAKSGSFKFYSQDSYGSDVAPPLSMVPMNTVQLQVSPEMSHTDSYSLFGNSD